MHTIDIHGINKSLLHSEDPMQNKKVNKININSHIDTNYFDIVTLRKKIILSITNLLLIADGSFLYLDKQL